MMLFSTALVKFYDTIVTLSLSKGLVWLLPKLCNSQSLTEESARAEILRLRYRSAQNDMLHFLLNTVFSTALVKFCNTVITPSGAQRSRGVSPRTLSQKRRRMQRFFPFVPQGQNDMLHFLPDAVLNKIFLLEQTSREPL